MPEYITDLMKKILMGKISIEKIKYRKSYSKMCVDFIFDVSNVSFWYITKKIIIFKFTTMMLSDLKSF